tara:strand:- start:72 stop:338 length:267 start_codon:yes stop_codon:yes gene_type:complete
MNFLDRKQKRIKAAFSGPDGEFLLAALLDFSGFYKQSFSENPYQTAFNEGKRAIALHLIQMLALTEEDMRSLVRDYREGMYSSSGDNS